MTDQKQRAVFWWCMMIALVLFWGTLLLLFGCGDAEGGGGAVLVGDYTKEEARAVAEVTAAFQDTLGTEPDVMVNFVHSPDARFRGKAWKDFRHIDSHYPNGYPARNEEEGYRGYYDREWHMVLVRRYGEVRAFLYELLVHELLHAMGYDYEDGTMKLAEKFIIEYLTIKEEGR